jgi:hypothetical protein
LFSFEVDEDAVIGRLDHHSRFFANARPEADFKYFSNAKASVRR